MADVVRVPAESPWKPDPTRIPEALVKQFYADMGFDPESFCHVTMMTIGPGGIRVTRRCVNEQGRPMAINGSPAVTTIDVKLDFRQAVPDA